MAISPAATPPAIQAICCKRKWTDWGFEAVIQTEQTIAINSPISHVWGYVNDLQKWANLMPGCRSCTVINPDDSRWVIKVGVGGLVRTVNVLVHVDQWNAPEQVNFSYILEGDPVAGGGSYIAARKSARETEVKLQIRVEGSGPMSPMWEAMSKPLLPQLAKSFAGKLKTEIERVAGATPTVATNRILGPWHFGQETS
jgi:carbon monoxide dehydrogenase subunit G